MKKHLVSVIALVVSLVGCDQVRTDLYPHIYDQETPSPDGGCMSDLFKGIPGGAFGNSAPVVEPALAAGVAPVGWGPMHTVNKFPGPMRKGNVLQETDPAIITASVYAEPQPTAAFAGPITGIALWGSGGSATNVAEFDVPVGTSFDPDFALSDPAPFDTPRGGTFISVVGTSLEIRARNDANLVPAGPTGDGVGQNPIGAFGAAAIAGTAPAFVSAALGRGTKVTTHSATKTVWSVNAVLAIFGVAPAASVFVRIPPFAKAFRIARGNATPPAALVAGAIRFTVFGNTFAGDGSYAVAASAIAPEVRISGQDTTIQITNAEAVDPILRLYVIFFLSI